MASVNKVIILGRLGKDPEVRYTQDGKPVTTLSIATSTISKDASGNKTEYTEWHRCVAFNSAAEAAGKYCKKGDQIYVEGSLRTKKWNDNGIDRYTTEITVGRLQFLGGKQNNEQSEPISIEIKPTISYGDLDDNPF